MRDPKDVNILVVDDEESLRKAIAFDFKKKGFGVLTAANGNEAFELVKANKIDVVLTDVRMPSGDGIELLDRLKSRDPDLPVVMFITGFSDITLDEAYDKGVDAVFSKPFDRKSLFAAVSRALSEKDVQWSGSQSERIQTDFKIALNVPDLQFALKGHVLNIGRGGIFVAATEKFPALDAHVNFDFEFSQGELQTLSGSGIVRWVRALEGPGQPSGFGLEFHHLNEQSRCHMLKVINALKIRAFIPRS